MRTCTSFHRTKAARRVSGRAVPGASHNYEAIRHVVPDFRKKRGRGEIHVSYEAEINDVIIPITAEALFQNRGALCMVKREFGDVKVIGVVDLGPLLPLQDFRVYGFLLHVNEDPEYEFVVAIVVDDLGIIGKQLLEHRIAEIF